MPSKKGQACCFDPVLIAPKTIKKGSENTDALRMAPKTLAIVQIKKGALATVQMAHKPLDAFQMGQETLDAFRMRQETLDASQMG